MEKLSWIATIVSALIAVAVWLQTDVQKESFHPTPPIGEIANQHVIPTPKSDLTKGKKKIEAAFFDTGKQPLQGTFQANTGSPSWSRFFPLKNQSKIEASVDLTVTNDGSIFVLSKVWNSSNLLGLAVGSDNSQLRKVDASGKILWTIEVGFPLSQDTPIGMVQADDDGVYVLCSSTQSDQTGWRGLLFRISKEGHVVWFRRIGGDDNRIRSIAVSTDGGVLVSGWAWFEDKDVSGAWIAHYSSDGSKKWDYVQKEIADDLFVSFGHLVTLQDGTIMALYHTNELGNGGLYWGRTSIIALNQNGEFISQTPIGLNDATGKIHNIPRQVLKTVDGGIIIALSERVYTDVELSKYQEYTRLIKTDKSICVEWSKRAVETKFPNQEIAVLQSGIIIGVGIVSHQIKIQSEEDKKMFGSRDRDTSGLVAKLSPAGDVLWTRIIDGQGQDIFRNIEVFPNDGLFILGTTTSLQHNLYTWLIKTDNKFNLSKIEWFSPEKPSF